MISVCPYVLYFWVLDFIVEKSRFAQFPYNRFGLAILFFIHLKIVLYFRIFSDVCMA